MKTTFEQFALGTSPLGNNMQEIAYALFRFYCGFSIADGAGLSKVFHKINEKGGDNWDNLAFGVGDWFVKQVGEIGFTFISPTFWAYLAVYGEFIGGLLVACGLFTRLSAIQMAFQFFVVSFLWYGDPAIFGMYYQQLIFWSFVVIAGIGGGKFSIDALILKNNFSINFNSKQTITAMKTISIFAVVVLSLSVFANGKAFAQAQEIKDQKKKVTISFKNNGILPRKYTFVTYWTKDRSNNATEGVVLAPYATKTITDVVETELFLADAAQVNTVMSGKSIGGKAFWVFKAEDDGKTINLRK